MHSNHVCDEEANNFPVNRRLRMSSHRRSVLHSRGIPIGSGPLYSLAVHDVQLNGLHDSGG